MTEVLAFEGVTLSRDGNEILRGIDFHVDGADRWVVLGPNGAGKTSLISIAGARSHPTSGVARVLGEVLGEADTQELRIRVGLSSAALADRIPPEEKRARRRHDGRARHHRPLARGVRGAGRGARGRVARGVWHGRFCGARVLDAERGRAQAGADRSRADGRPRVAACSTSRPRAWILVGARSCSRPSPSSPADRRSPAIVLVTHHVEEIPVGFTHVLLLRGGEVVAAGPIERGAHGREPVARRMRWPWSSARTAGDTRPDAQARLGTRRQA